MRDLPQRKIPLFLMSGIEKNNRKTIRGWVFYDWANSVYSLVVTTAIFPVYYNSVTTSAGGDIVSFFGFYLKNSVLYEYSLSFSFLLIAALAPLLSGIADYGGKRKFFMKIFTYVGSLSCIALALFDGSNIEYGILCSMMASIGFSGSLVFYNSYLPAIATPDRYDQISARGFSMGYAGSLILLSLSLALIAAGESLGFSDAKLPPRISFAMVGLWWAGFAQITFNRLPENRGRSLNNQRLFESGYIEISLIWSRIRKMRDLKKFVFAFFFFNTGVQTIIYLASLFGSKTLNMSSEKLILTILLIQVVAIFGSMLFAKVSGSRGNRATLMTLIILWIVVCVSAYFITKEIHFFILAFIVGLVMGGIQSLSRATYSKFIPIDTDDHTSYFSFYDVTEKISLVVGTFSYALIDHITGSMRLSSLMLAGFFVTGLVILSSVKVPFSKNAKS